MATKDPKSDGDSAKTGADRSDRLESLGLLVDGTTKTIATWAAALIVFAYFGFGQREWQLHSGREALTKIRSEATRLKRGFDEQERT